MNTVNLGNDLIDNYDDNLLKLVYYQNRNYSGC